MYLIYGKSKDGKKFKPYGDGGLQTNLIFAEYFKDEQKEALETRVKVMNETYAGEYVFEIRYTKDW